MMPYYAFCAVRLLPDGCRSQKAVAALMRRNGSCLRGQVAQLRDELDLVLGGDLEIRPPLLPKFLRGRCSRRPVFSDSARSAVAASLCWFIAPNLPLLTASIQEIPDRLAIEQTLSFNCSGLADADAVDFSFRR
jgi:hypothetical protein